MWRSTFIPYKNTAFFLNFAVSLCLLVLQMGHSSIFKFNGNLNKKLVVLPPANKVADILELVTANDAMFALTQILANN